MRNAAIEVLTAIIFDAPPPSRRMVMTRDAASSMKLPVNSAGR